jgi:hypothetical protein
MIALSPGRLIIVAGVGLKHTPTPHQGDTVINQYFQVNGAD